MKGHNYTILNTRFTKYGISGIFASFVINLRYISMKATSNIELISTLQEVVPVINDSSLLVLDIDDTVVVATTHIGSGKWEKSLRQEFRDEGFSEEEAFIKAENIWNEAQENTFVRPTENDVFTLLSHKQCLGCTARSPNLIDITMRQLSLAGVSFTDEEMSYPIMETPLVYFHNGIIFCGGVSKATALFSFLENFPSPPQIIMVDDTLHHLEDVSTVAQQRDIEFIGFFYDKFNH